VSQVVDPAHVDGNEIDLDVVREILSHFTYHDFQEAQELILGALMEVNQRFGWVSLEAAKVVADYFGTSDNRVYALLTFYADFRTQPRGKHFMLLCHGMSCYVMGSRKLIDELEQKYGVVDGEYVIVESPKDHIRIKAKVVEGLVPGCVSVRHGHGFGHWAMGSVAKGKGAHSNNLMDTHTSPITGANCYNECKVRIRPA